MRLGLGLEPVQGDDRRVGAHRRVEGDDGGGVAAGVVGVVVDRAGHVAGDRDRLAATGPLGAAHKRRAHDLGHVLAREQRVADEPVGDRARGLDHARVHAGHVDGQVGAQRRGHRRGGPHDQAVEAAVVLDRPLVQAQQPAQERDELLHAAGRVLAVQAVPVLLHALGAGPEPEDDAAARERIEVARLGGEHERRVPERVGDGAADGDALGRRRDRAHGHRGRAVGEVRRPHRLEPGLLGHAGGLDGLAHVGQRQDEAEAAHCGCSVSPRSSMATNFSSRRARVSGRLASRSR